MLSSGTITFWDQPFSKYVIFFEKTNTSNPPDIHTHVQRVTVLSQFVALRRI